MNTKLTDIPGDLPPNPYTRDEPTLEPPKTNTNPTTPPEPPGPTQPVTNPDVYEAYLHNAPRPRRLPQGHQHPIISRLNLDECRAAAIKIMSTDVDLFIIRQSDGKTVWNNGRLVDPDATVDVGDAGDDNGVVTKPDKGS